MSATKWSKLFKESTIERFKLKQINFNFLKSKANRTVVNDNAEKARKCSPWLKKIITASYKSSSPVNSSNKNSNQVTSTESNFTLEPLETNGNHSSNSTSSQEKEIVPLRQFLRYSVNQSDIRSYSRRRLVRPFEPIYEIEWQKNQWLQLDQSTCKHIERLRQNGFSKIAIRNDTSLNKHIKYDNPSEMDVLLEISLHNINDSNTSHTNTQLEPILCHQSNHFHIRRTYWWHSNYKIGEAYLPAWVDQDLCCSAVIMDAPSVLAALSSYSKATLNSVSKPPSATKTFQKPSLVEFYYSSVPQAYKPLRYAEPSFLFESSTAMA